MQEIINELNNALNNIQEIKLDGTYFNVTRMARAIESIMRAGDMINAKAQAQTNDQEPSREAQNNPVIVEVEDIGNGNNHAE